MNKIKFSNGELSVCHKGNCVSVNGKIANAIIFSIAAIVVVSGIASTLK